MPKAEVESLDLGKGYNLQFCKSTKEKLKDMRSLKFMDFTVQITISGKITFL